MRRSGATPNDENADRGDSGQQDMQFICGQFLRCFRTQAEELRKKELPTCMGSVFGYMNDIGFTSLDKNIAIG